MTNIYQSFYLQDDGENQLAYVWNGITSLSPYVFEVVGVCLAERYPVCHVAINMPADQVSVLSDEYGEHGAGNAVDGGRNTSHESFSCTHSLEANRPWLMVDLGTPLTVTGVHFINSNSWGT